MVIKLYPHRILLVAALITCSANSAHAQFGIGQILNGGRNSGVSSRPVTNAFSQRTNSSRRMIPPPMIPTPRVGMGIPPGPSLGKAVGRSVLSSAMETINERVYRPTTPVASAPRWTERPVTSSPEKKQVCCPEPDPNSEVVIISGGGDTSGSVYYSPSTQSSVVVAQTPVAAADTVSAPASGSTEDTNPLAELRSLVEESKRLFRQQRYREAIQQLDRAIILAPENSDVLQFRGFAHFATGDVDSASADVYDAFLYGNTWDWQAVYDLYQSKSRYEQQLRKLEQFRRASPSMSSHFLLGYHYLVLGSLSRGKKELDKALALQPEEPLIGKLVTVVGQRVASDKAN